MAAVAGVMVVATRSPAVRVPIWLVDDASRMPMLAPTANAPASTTAAMAPAVISAVRRSGCRLVMAATVRTTRTRPGQPIAKVWPTDAPTHRHRCEPLGVRLLVVEDDPRISDPLQEGLDREGYDVVVAATGADALAADRHRSRPARPRPPRPRRTASCAANYAPAARTDHRRQRPRRRDRPSHAPRARRRRLRRQAVRVPRARRPDPGRLPPRRHRGQPPPPPTPPSPSARCTSIDAPERVTYRRDPHQPHPQGVRPARLPRRRPRHRQETANN